MFLPTYELYGVQAHGHRRRPLGGILFGLENVTVAWIYNVVASKWVKYQF